MYEHHKLEHYNNIMQGVICNCYSQRCLVDSAHIVYQILVSILQKCQCVCSCLSNNSSILTMILWITTIRAATSNSFFTLSISWLSPVKSTKGIELIYPQHTVAMAFKYRDRNSLQISSSFSTIGSAPTPSRTKPCLSILNYMAIFILFDYSIGVLSKS